MQICVQLFILRRRRADAGDTVQRQRDCVPAFRLGIVAVIVGLSPARYYHNQFREPPRTTIANNPDRKHRGYASRS